MQKSKSFLLPMFKFPNYIYNYIDTYVGNIYYEGTEDWGNYFYVEVEPSKLSENIRTVFRAHPQFRTEYHEEDSIFFVFDFTETQKNNIVKPFLDGKYSKIDREYVAANFPKHTATGTVSTNWRILVRDEWDRPTNVMSLKEYQESRFNTEEGKKYGLAVYLPDDAEVWDRPYKRDEVYGYNLLNQLVSMDQQTDLT